MTASETTRLLPEDPPDLVSATKGTEDPSKSSRPQLLITIGLCLSIFCVSLVSRVEGPCWPTHRGQWTADMLIRVYLAGPNGSRDCYSSHHG